MARGLRAGVKIVRNLTGHYVKQGCGQKLDKNNFILILTWSQDSNYDNYDCVNGIMCLLISRFLAFLFSFFLVCQLTGSPPAFFSFFLSLREGPGSAECATRLGGMWDPARRNVRNESSIEAWHE